MHHEKNAAVLMTENKCTFKYFSIPKSQDSGTQYKILTVTFGQKDFGGSKQSTIVM